jgi:uncharacterized delta-60 repeat protein
VQSDGKIVVLSTSTAVDGEQDMLVTRFSANGALDTSFGGGTGYVRLDIDGAASPTREIAQTVIHQSDGKIVAVGSIHTDPIDEPDTVFVARLNSNGTLDSTFGAGGFKVGAQSTSGQNFKPNGVAIQSDGSIIVAGADNEAANVAHPFLMRFFGSTSPLLAAGADAAATSNAQSLTMTHSPPLLTEAIARWEPGATATPRRAPALALSHEAQIPILNWVALDDEDDFAKSADAFFAAFDDLAASAFPG